MEKLAKLVKITSSVILLVKVGGVTVSSSWIGCWVASLLDSAISNLFLVAVLLTETDWIR